MRFLPVVASFCWLLIIGFVDSTVTLEDRVNHCATIFDVPEYNYVAEKAQARAVEDFQGRFCINIQQYDNKPLEEKSSLFLGLMEVKRSGNSEQLSCYGRFSKSLYGRYLYTNRTPEHMNPRRYQRSTFGWIKSMFDGIRMNSRNVSLETKPNGLYYVDALGNYISTETDSKRILIYTSFCQALSIYYNEIFPSTFRKKDSTSARERIEAYQTEQISA